MIMKLQVTELFISCADPLSLSQVASHAILVSYQRASTLSSPVYGMEEDKQSSNAARSNAALYYQSALSSPARLPRGSQEPSAHDYDTSAAPSTEEDAIATAISLAQSATSSTVPYVFEVTAHGPRTHVEKQYTTGLVDTQLASDKLRVAMEGGDTNLFSPLEVVLVDLIKIGGSLEVRLFCWMWYFPNYLTFIRTT